MPLTLSEEFVYSARAVAKQNAASSDGALAIVLEFARMIQREEMVQRMPNEVACCNSVLDKGVLCATTSASRARFL